MGSNPILRSNFMFITKPVQISVPAFDAYMDGGTLEFKVLNPEEVGIASVYQDFRLDSTSKGKYYTGYPGYPNSTEIIDNFIHKIDK